MKKSKLIIEYDYDFELWGIRTSLRGYRLAWQLNTSLALHLVRQPDLLVGFKKNEEKKFSFYAHETPLNRLKLFKNKPVEADAGKYFLVPEFPHFDFIFLIQMDNAAQREQLVAALRQIPAVELVSAIPTAGLKSKSNFIF
jgi:hypothetical protein